MKKLLFALSISVFIFTGCKKDDPTPEFDLTSSPINVDVSGLTQQTSVYIKIINTTNNNEVILDLENKFGNTTYNSLDAVKSGDVLKIEYKSNIGTDTQGNGNGTLKFNYKGFNVLTAGGAIGYPNWKSKTVTIPNVLKQ